MIFGIVLTPYVGFNQRTIRIRKSILVECDMCGTHYRRSACASRPLVRQYHYCTRQCVDAARRKGNLIFVQSRARSLNKWGVDAPMQNAALVEKVRQTNLQRYGAACTLWAKDIHEKIRQVWLTNLGVDHPMKSNIVQDKCRKTLFDNYGVTNAYAIHDVQKKARSKEAFLKRHETMKRNGTFRKSGPEDCLYLLLCDKFGTDDVVRQVPIEGKRWLIDFYVKSIDTYIQFDGTYWHGLDRPIEVIAEHRTPRDVVIHRKWLTDCEQDTWFTESKKRLVRISDIDLEQGIDVMKRFLQ